MDQAINFVANDPRFQYLWHDEDWIKQIYDDTKFCDAVEALMTEIRDIAHKENATFFHKFVHHEYARDLRNFRRDTLLADDHKFRLRARGATMLGDVTEEINESTSEIGTPVSNGESRLRKRVSPIASSSIHHGHHSETNSSILSGSNVTQYFANDEKGKHNVNYERPFLKVYEDSLKKDKHHHQHHSASKKNGKFQFGIDCCFKIIHPNHHKRARYKQAVKDDKWYFRLPSVHPGEKRDKSQWVQWKWSKKKIKEFGQPGTKRGYWELIGGKPECRLKQKDQKDQNDLDDANGISFPMERLNSIEMKEMKEKEKKKRKAKEIPVQHLNYVLGLMRLYLKWVVENCDEGSKESQTRWIYEKVSHAFVWTEKTGMKIPTKKDIEIVIQEPLDSTEIINSSFSSSHEKDKITKYRISWMNGGNGKDKPFAMAMRKENDSRDHYFMCFRAAIQDKIEWQWYNNDEKSFSKFKPYEVFAQLEASFQANLHSNFPFGLKVGGGHTPRARDLKQLGSSFNLPCLPELLNDIGDNGEKKRYLLRFTFTKSKRIKDMHQEAVSPRHPPFPRRVRRMVKGTNEDTLYAYFLKKDDFVEEWKERFLVSEQTQQYFFWSFVLAISTTMKYMELEMENQFITFSFRRKNKRPPTDRHGLDNLDTSDLRREIRDLDLFDGFIVPPYQIMQIAELGDSEDTMRPRDWYRTLSCVGILERVNFCDAQLGTLRHKDDKERRKEGLNSQERFRTCPHEGIKGQLEEAYPYKGPLGTLYCHRCAAMMRFGEYLRKFCLEYEHRELMQHLWPWHKNTFHESDKQKYHEAIARQNFNFLFDSEDLLNYVPEHHLYEDSSEDELDDEPPELKEDHSSSKGRHRKNVSSGEQINQSLRARSGSLRQSDRVRGVYGADDNSFMTEAHIRHQRKYAARFMLGPWESLKNLNIIKVQMGAVFEQLEVDRVHAEVAAAAKESIDVKFCEDKVKELLNVSKGDKKDAMYINTDLYEMKPEETVKAKKWQIPPQEWPEWLESWNQKLSAKLHRVGRNPNWLMILKLTKFKQLDVDSMAPKQLPNWDNFLQWALSPIYNGDFSDRYKEEYDDDDPDMYDDEMTDTEIPEIMEDLLPGIVRGTGAQSIVQKDSRLQSLMNEQWKTKFRQSWTRTPKWWSIGHDKILIEMAVQYQFNERKYWDAMNTKGRYYRMRLKQSLKNQNYVQDVAFHEFKNWCKRWENIMHRVRYISSVVARKLASLKTSIVGMLIDEEKDRPTWSLGSLIFVNDNQALAHYQRIKKLPKPPDFQKLKKRKQKQREEPSMNESIEFDNVSDDGSDSLDLDQHFFNKPRAVPVFRTKTKAILDIKKELFLPRKGTGIKFWKDKFKECRVRDPFQIRDLGFELKEILHTFDLVTYGESMAKFVIELLRTRNLTSLWTFLGLLLKTMPNKTALKIMYEHRTQLRRARPADLDWICRQVIQGTRFIIPACLFLSHFMRENADDDLSRTNVWERFSKKYEDYAAEQVRSVEDDFMLTVLMNIPVYKGEITLTQLALEQHNTTFLNSERVNRMVTHTWISANPLNPHIEMLAHKKNPKKSFRDSYEILKKKPIYFYLTPLGFQTCISTFFLAYVILIMAFIADRLPSAMNVSKVHKYDGLGLYSADMTAFEYIIWIANLGFMYTEVEQYLDLGRAYFCVSGGTNLWDIIMSMLWLFLLLTRFTMYFQANSAGRSRGGYEWLYNKFKFFSPLMDYDNLNQPYFDKSPEYSIITEARRRRLMEEQKSKNESSKSETLQKSKSRLTEMETAGFTSNSAHSEKSSAAKRHKLMDGTDDSIYCPPDFFSCTIEYNDTCLMEISSHENRVIDWICDYNDDYNRHRRLQDSDIGMDYNLPISDYQDTDTDSAASDGSTAFGVDSYTGENCTTWEIRDTSHPQYKWDESICWNYDENWNYTVNGDPSCRVLLDYTCAPERDTFLLAYYNGVWAAQLCMLTMRLLSYYECVGGFYGILLRIISAMMLEVLKFGLIIFVVSFGFFAAVWLLFAVDVNTGQPATGYTYYDNLIFFFKLLFGGGNVGTIDTYYETYRVFAQCIVMVFAIIGIRMFMSLLIALMSGAMSRVRQRAKAEQSYTSALYAYELSTSGRTMPMPLNVPVVMLTFVIHFLNFPLALISPEYLNIYAYVNQKRLYGPDCFYDSARKKKLEPVNHMKTRKRVLYYYMSSVCGMWLTRKLVRYDWHIFHVGCYNAIIGTRGTEELEVTTMNEYYSILETKRKNDAENRKLNVYDKLFLKHLTLKCRFCKHCFRPVAIENPRKELVTPMVALQNLLSCYMFLLLWPFFLCAMWILTQFERLYVYYQEELRAHSPKMLKTRHREYDLEYFPRSSVKPLSARRKNRNDRKRAGTGGAEDGVDINYDEMDDGGY